MKMFWICTFVVNAEIRLKLECVRMIGSFVSCTFKESKNFARLTVGIQNSGS